MRTLGPSATAWESRALMSAGVDAGIVVMSMAVAADQDERPLRYPPPVVLVPGGDFGSGSANVHGPGPTGVLVSPQRGRVRTRCEALAR
ncbi:hypothetical protein R4282_12055 [Rhodococcus oxybenzonivorans]|uniref:hypothetical protein n=1 Tax=Rhodococcus oxybenzonivorans TaxID=1990687 RepID=UPI002955ADBB|nr:hypothetical protein [Rhodococcus oxybenzonivorans]MDV7353739.1 hypothetical protein [Rhodococcus oxybenzonivorans]